MIGGARRRLSNSLAQMNLSTRTANVLRMLVGSVDVVLDLIGGEFVERSFNVLKPGGRFVTAAAMLSPDAGKDRGIVAMGTFTQPIG